MQVLTSHYVDKEQKNTLFKLNERIKSTPFELLNNEIVVTIDRNTFTNTGKIRVQITSIPPLEPE